MGVWAPLCCAVSGLWSPTAALAQAAAAASAPSAEMTPAERAQRDADKVFKWILIHSDKPRKPVAAREDKPVATPAHARPATRSADSAQATPHTLSSAPTPSPTPETPAAVPRVAAVQTPPLRASEAPAAPVVAAVARPVAESLAVPVSSPGPSTRTPAAVAAEALDETLTPTLRADPQFPPNLLRTLRKGEVQVRFTVLPDGSVAEPEVVTSSNARLNQAALTAVAQWRFAPLHKAKSGTVALGFDLD
ncbi:MAG: TonB family protein [Burkholderiales bacterium]